MIENFYKKLGLFFNNRRNVVYISFLSLFIFFMVGFSKMNAFHKLKEAALEITSLEKISINSKDQRKKNNSFIECIKKSDCFFIDNNLENLSFLKTEKNILEKLNKHIAFSNSTQISDRLKFINSSENKLKFAEENIKSSTLYKETDETQLNTIQVDENDLVNLLSIIEGDRSLNFKTIKGSPQLIIKNFDLYKEKNNYFTLDMKLLKREFLENDEK